MTCICVLTLLLLLFLKRPLELPFTVKKIRWITMDLSHTLQACLHGTKPTFFRYLGPWYVVQSPSYLSLDLPSLLVVRPQSNVVVCVACQQSLDLLSSLSPDPFTSMGDKFAFRFNDIEKKVDNIDRRMTKMDEVLEKVLAYVSDVPLDV